MKLLKTVGLDDKDNKIVSAAIATLVVVVLALYIVSHYSESMCDTIGLRYLGETSEAGE